LYLPEISCYKSDIATSYFASFQYDILITGGGTAGITLASRLFELSPYKIGIIEAGELVNPGQNSLVDTPALSWGFNTSPQAQISGRNLSYPRGKMVGGSSGINSMAWVRPTRNELDSWSSFGISNGWDWQGLLAYMKRTENVTIGNSSSFPGSKYPSGYDSLVEGRAGPVQISYNNVFSGVQVPFVESFLQAGGILNGNPDNGNNIGIFNGAHSVDPETGNRSYATTAYLPTLQQNPNIVLLLKAMVTRIIFDETSPNLKATGLKYVIGNDTYTVSAKREVIISAGSVQTPQLLELSGIGNASLLQAMGIRPILDIPTVGENFQDHLSVPTSFLLHDPPPSTLDELNNNASFAEQQLQQYLVNHTGFYTMLPTYSYHPLQQFISDADINELISVTQREISERKLSRLQKLQYELQIEWLQTGIAGQLEIALFPGGIPDLPGATVAGKSYVSIVSFPQHPFSRGSVHIASYNPLDAPIIDPDILNFTFNHYVLNLGLTLCSRIASEAPLSNLIKVTTNPPNNDLSSYISSTINMEYNGIGTTALASQELGGVVNDNLLVYGTLNLRIVDASIIPIHMATHIQTLVYAVALKAADIIISS
ncbi:alcohol oxidase, partial [Lentinula aciculospora]